jgi:hypothetical protein
MNKTLKTSAPLLIALALCAAALILFVDVKLTDTPGIRMELPRELGAWTGSAPGYCHQQDCLKSFYEQDLGADKTACPSCGGPLFPMSYEEWKELPKDTKFLKTRYEGENKASLFVSVVLSGQDRESIHRPERCLIGQGFTITASRVVPVSLPGGRNIRLMVLENQREIRTPNGTETYYGYYSYWFVGVGRETHSHWSRMFWLAWDRIVHSVSHQWAYVAVSGVRSHGSDDYLDTLRDLVSELHGQIVL